MGAGPEHLLRAGLVGFLEARGFEVSAETLADEGLTPQSEVRSAFELMRRLAQRVRAARGVGQFPLVLAGNCNTACGTLAGLPEGARAAFWFDAHGDLNTPSTTKTGFIDGMGLATARGLCWEQLAASIPGFVPISPDRIVLLGVRDLDAPERLLIAKAQIAHLPPARLAGGMAAILARPAFRGCLAYVHCDLDVLDPSVGQANPFSVPEGVSVEALTAAIAAIGAAVPFGAAAITAYAPEYDATGSVQNAAFRVADAILASANGG